MKIFINVSGGYLLALFLYESNYIMSFVVFVIILLANTMLFVLDTINYLEDIKQKILYHELKTRNKEVQKKINKSINKDERRN